MSATVIIPPYWQMFIFSSVGALLLWMKLSIHKKKVHALSDVVEQLFPESLRAQYIIQFVFFVIFGGFIGVLFVGPYTQLQAVAGGVAWSRLAARD